MGGGKSSLAEKLKSLVEKVPFYAIKGSPVHESPLGLFNVDEDGRILEADYGIPRRYLNTIMSPWAVKRLHEFNGDITKFRVVKLRPSVLRQIAVAKTEPGDENNTPKVAIQRALELVQQKGVRGVITDSSQDDIALNSLFYDADTTNDLNVPIVCMACTSPAINNPLSVNAADAVNQATLRNSLHWNFRALMDAMPQAKVFVRIAQGKAENGDVNGDKLFKLTVYYSDEAFGRGFADALKITVAALALPIPATISATDPTPTTSAGTMSATGTGTSDPSTTAGPTTDPSTTAGPTTDPSTTAGPTTDPSTTIGPDTTGETTMGVSDTNSSSSTGEPAPVCGDGLIDVGEECDDANEHHRGPEA